MNKNQKVEELILELQDTFKIKERIGPTTLEKLHNTGGSQLSGPDAFLNYLKTDYPNLLLSEKYSERKKIEETEIRKMRREWEFSPRFPLPELIKKEEREPDASPRQKRFLRILGVRDKSLIRNIGKYQAGDFIDKVKEAREKALERAYEREDQTVQTSGCLGVITFSGIFVYLLERIISI